MELLNQELVMMLWAYSTETISLKEYRRWFAANVWGLSQSKSPLDRMITGELEVVLAEYDRKDRDSKYVKEQVQLLLSLPNPLLFERQEFRGDYLAHLMAA